MLGKNTISLIKSLEHKKYRLSEKLFIAEGEKIVRELLFSDIRVELLAGTPDYLAGLKGYTAEINEITEATEAEIKKASFLQTPRSCLAICRIPEYSLPANPGVNNLLICLDNLQDPGNLGTIVRIADWFGIPDLICSHNTADIYNPKTIQATMGSFTRVRVHYTDLFSFLSESRRNGVTVYGSFLQGENIYNAPLSQHGIAVAGKEGSGISAQLEPLVNIRLTIPGFPPQNPKAESLNVSAATAILCSEFRRRC